MKFGLVGVIAFIIDWGILNLLVGVFHMHNVLAATISFIISLIFNYIASMKLVFKHRDDWPVGWKSSFSWSARSSACS